MDDGVSGGGAQGGQAGAHCPTSSCLCCLHSCRWSGSLLGQIKLIKTRNYFLMAEIICSAKNQVPQEHSKMCIIFFVL